MAGDAVYSQGIIEAWSAFADLTVLCADSGADPSVGTDEVAWHIVGPQRSGRAASVPSRFPLIAWKGATRQYRKKLGELLQDPGWDAIVLDNLGLTHALPKAEAYRRQHPDTRIVYVSIEWEYPTRAGKYDSYQMSRVKRFAATLDLAKVRRWEEALIRRSDIVTVINPSDLEPFRRIDASRKYLTVLPGYSGPVAADRDITDAVPRRVLILGGRRPEQKQQVLLDWLAVSNEAISTAGIEVVVVGDIPDDLRTRVESTYPDVVVLGFTDHLDELIAEARAGLIVDTLGSGFKLRLLSHVFQRLPIVGLSDAIDGLPTPEGEGYLAAPTLVELVELVCQAVDRPEQLDAVQKRAFTDCDSQFSWAQRGELLASLLDPTAEDNLV
ncbi:hypothetical protein [Nocardioides sp. Kera G14]|uniref:hypothetical protein n=1 Tax=Nocardioides sp. Kera G14 TaxID=2884264 RepID=UPI001D12DA30|nr:hypothetical protein [Nocardioides sp. Kera G14]UDY23107.1 hypothetical protein LH076_13700 [Nocardioides sp. Kera G14]